MKRIGDMLTRNKTPVLVRDDVTYKQVTIRTNYKGVVLRGSQNGSSIGTKNQSAVSAGQFILSRIDARNGAFGIVPEELEGAIVTNDFLAFDINEEEVEREFFNVFLQAPQFLEACIKASRGNTNRKRVDEDFFLTNLHRAARLDHLARAVPSWLWLEPDAVVRSAMRALARGRDSVTPGYVYRVSRPFLASDAAQNLWRRLVRRGRSTR